METIRFQLKGNELFFKLSNQTHKIGSKYYPLSQKSKAKIFIWDNTEQINNEILSLNLKRYKSQFKIGRCYTNTELLRLFGRELNLEIQYYSGWLFIGGNYPPIHHAFAVYNNNIIDVGVSPLQIEITSKFNYENVNWREDLAKKLIELQKSNINYLDNIVFGKVPKGIMYIGSPDTREHAIDTFTRIRNNYPNHPSYNNDGMSISGRSKLQLEMLKIDKTL